MMTTSTAAATLTLTSVCRQRQNDDRKAKYVCVEHAYFACIYHSFTGKTYRNAFYVHIIAFHWTFKFLLILNAQK